MFRTTKRHTVEYSEAMQACGVGSYDPTDSIDDFLDAGGSFMHETVRGFPEQWTSEAVTHTKKFYATKFYMTQLRACEMGVSRTYERHQYAPSWNAPHFPERRILEHCGHLKRDETKAPKAQQEAKAKAAREDRRRPGPGSSGQTKEAGSHPAESNGSAARAAGLNTGAGVTA